jgi:hypothetical protein
MTTNSWTAGGGHFNFGTANTTDPDWSLDETPSSTEDAVINTGASTAQITATTNEDVGSISLGSNDSLVLGSGSIFAAVNGTGSNVNNGAIKINYADLVIGNSSNTSTFDNASTGSIVLNGTGANAPAVLFIQGSVNLTGSGSIAMTVGDPAADNIIIGDFLDGITNTLTNETEDIAGSGTIGTDLDFINDATVESKSGTLVIQGSVGDGSFTNAGTVQADDGGTVVFGEDGQSSTIVNSGLVADDSTGDTTSLEIAGNVTISGTGSGFDTIALTGSNTGNAANFDQVVSDGHSATLTLVNQTIKGAGTLGDSNLTLDNQSGTINSNDPGQLLQLNTGNNTITNGGTLEATDDASLIIESPVDSTGTIQALSGSGINDSAAITGSVSIGADGELYLTDVGSVSGNVTLAGADVQLWLDSGGPHDGLNGEIVGAQAGDVMISFNLVYTSSMRTVWTQTSSSGGTLALQEGGSTIFSFNLAGQYDGSDFTVTSFVDGSVQINLPNPMASAGTTGAMIMRDGSNGGFEIYDLGNNGIQAAYALGDISTAWQVAGVGGFNSTDTYDMILRNSSTGALELYDLSNNNVTPNSEVTLGQVGLQWQVSGFGDFSGNPGETDMLMQNSGSGDFEVYDISNNRITNAAPMGQVGAPWVVAGFGDFSGNARETGDMLMRNGTTGAFEVYDVTNNQITFAGGMGQVGLEWSVAGFGDFSGNANETDMLMRNTSTGAFEIYDISNNAIYNAASMGQVGLEWQVVGFGPIDGAGTSDMLMRNTSTGAFELYDIGNNQITNAVSMGQVGTAWSVAGIAADPPGAAPANAQLVQAMASMATSAPISAGNTPQIGAETSAQTLLTMPQAG